LIQCEEAEGKRSEEVFDLSDDPLGIQPASVPIAPEALAEMREQMAQAFPLRRNQF